MDATKLKVWLPFDESATADKCGNTWTATGNVSLDTTITKFGGASVHLPSGAYLTANNIINLNADKWTFDAWAYCVSSTGDDGFIALSEGASRRGITAGNDGVYVASSGGGSWQKSTSSVKFPSVKNQWVHLAIVKNDTTVTFYQDGVSVWSFTTSALNNNGVFILGGSSYGYGNDIYFDEVRFFEGDALWTENFTPPTAEDYQDLSIELDGQFIFAVDVERKLSNVVEFTADVQRTLKTKWRYINLGTADTLITTGTTLENLDESKSVTGTAFYQTTRAKCFDLSATDEVWIKFDVYFNGSDRWRAYNGGTNGITGITAQTTGDLSFFSNETNVQQSTSICKKNQLQTVLLHMISGSSAGVVEAWVDGTKIYTYTGDV
ncbi:MAG: LamG domain-containing protein, partial [Selenomonadaceae bacterium]|nr:LamG domain-containing protein [Selenomonadaceae bacterium]